MISEMKAPARLNYGRIPNLVDTKDLIATQTDSFDWFLSDGLRELFDEINPITDYSGKNFELRFLDFEFGTPKFSVEECRNRDMTYAAPLRIRTRLTIRETGEIKESEVYMGDFPMMTPEGTFIINGTERVVVSQLVRSPGVYFTAVEDPASGRRLFGAKLIPNRGAWTTRARCCRACSSTRAGSTWAAWGATRGTAASAVPRRRSRSGCARGR